VYPKPFFAVLDKPVNAIVERLNPDFFKSPQAATDVAGFSRARVSAARDAAPLR